MVQFIRPKSHTCDACRREAQETTTQLQARLQRAVNRGWLPQRKLPDGVMLIHPETGEQIRGLMPGHTKRKPRKGKGK